MDRQKIVAFTGAGISAESGLQTFRDANGLWHDYSIEDVATPEAWTQNPDRVLAFYNHRRSDVESVRPNAAHDAIARLEQQYEVVVVTQNIDDLHERAGSSNVIHVHGLITQARSVLDELQVFDIGYGPIQVGDTCVRGGQLRPHVVWFGESVLHMDQAAHHIESAARILVVGTSLSVFPAAGLLGVAREDAEKLIIALEVDDVPDGFRLLREKATESVPQVVNTWLHLAKSKPPEENSS